MGSATINRLPSTVKGFTLLTTFFVAIALFSTATIEHAEAAATLWSVNCPNTHETYQNFPHSAVYSGGRLETQWKIDVQQPVNYDLVVSSAGMQMGRNSGGVGHRIVGLHL